MGEKRLCYGCMELKSDSDTVCPNCGYEDHASFDDQYIKPGTSINERYTVGIMLNHNSEGATYLGYNNFIGCKVLIREYMPAGLCIRAKDTPAIDILSDKAAQYKTLMADFAALNKSLAQMRNVPHINTTLDLFSENNTTYAVYEYLEGVKLVDYLKENAGELTWKQVSEMFPTFFTTLSLIHNNAIIHRAISPDTIYVTEKNELRLCAFCIPSVRTMHTELPYELFQGYAAPEQYTASGKQGTWTDVYGICAVLYRILTGCKPTDAPSRLQNDNLCEPHEMNPNIPKHVSNVIMKGMNLITDERIQTVTELVTQLFDQPEEESKPKPKPVPAEQPRRTQKQSPHQEHHHDANRRQRSRREGYERVDYVAEEHETVIDRIKIPIIIGVLLICVFLVIAIVVFNLLGTTPFPEDSNATLETAEPTTIPETTNQTLVPEPTDDEEETEEVTGDSQMPELIGRNFDTMKQKLEEEGWLYLEAIYDYSDEYKAGLIFDQEIPAGEMFNSGATIEVKVSKGPSSIIIPEYEGKTLDAYEKELEKLGMSSYNREAVVNYEYKNGFVISLSVEAGEKFDLTGSETLKIYYADNPNVVETEAYNNWDNDWDDDDDSDNDNDWADDDLSEEIFTNPPAPGFSYD